MGWPSCASGYVTACVATENPGRGRWAGVDISPKAVELVNMRLQQSMGDLFHNRLVTARTDIPRRTDIDAPVPYRQNKHVLFGQQGGQCNSCRSASSRSTPLRWTTSSPRRRRPAQHREPAAACAQCNRVKGYRPQEYLLARLRELRIVGDLPVQTNLITRLRLNR